MSGIEEDIVTPNRRNIYGVGYWVLYLFIVALFLAIVAMGFKHGTGDGSAGVIASGLLWVLYSAYPIHPRQDTS